MTEKSGATLEYKYYLNGFPKSGLHLIAAMMLPVARPLPGTDGFGRPWAGTFHRNSWTTEWIDSEKVLYRAGRLTAGHFLKAHTGYRPEIERFLYYFGAATVFIYRDLRDVAVSQAYHVISEDDQRMAHPDKDLYRSLGSFDKVLEAVIVGIDCYPGVIERWELYAPWLDVDWIYKVRFEDAISDTARIAGELLDYGINRAAKIFGQQAVFDSGAFDLAVAQMVRTSQQTDRSPTFRRGVPGAWREEFSERHKELFKEMDKHGWLVRLGYAEEEDW